MDDDQIGNDLNLEEDLKMLDHLQYVIGLHRKSRGQYLGAIKDYGKKSKSRWSSKSSIEKAKGKARVADADLFRTTEYLRTAMEKYLSILPPRQQDNG